jgi:hypothetical protein
MLRAHVLRAHLLDNFQPNAEANQVNLTIVGGNIRAVEGTHASSECCGRRLLASSETSGNVRA